MLLGNHMVGMPTKNSAVFVVTDFLTVFFILLLMLVLQVLLNRYCCATLCIYIPAASPELFLYPRI